MTVLDLDDPRSGAVPASRRPKIAYEFFAGGGMARLGLGRGWRCAFANDVDARKAEAYAANFGARGFERGDVAAVTARQLPGRADLAWASFPCQDLSLAGPGGGLDGARSGVVWPFLRLMRALADAGRGPRLLALENVGGLATARGGQDLRALLAAVDEAGWRPGALMIDAARFLPQSRPRLFIVAAAPDLDVRGFTRRSAEPGWTPPALSRALADAPVAVAHWRLPEPRRAGPSLAKIVETPPPPHDPEAALGWRSREDVDRLLGLATGLQIEKLRRAAARTRRRGRPSYGTLFARGRPGADGAIRQKIELRFDGVAGCLRTPAGGSSRQNLVVVRPDGSVGVRLFTPREAARLMGLPERYVLPTTRTEAYRLAGDGVAVPVVRHLARHLLGPLLEPISDA